MALLRDIRSGTRLFIRHEPFDGYDGNAHGSNAMKTDSFSPPSFLYRVTRLGLAAVLSFGIGVAFAADPVPARAIAAAADAFVETLNDEQRRTLQFDIDDAEQRVRWSNLPISSVKRAGLRTGDLTPEQLEAMHALLRAVLSSKGYDKIIGIVRSDEVLKRRGGNQSFGEDQFFISFMGRPSATEPWMLQFGGHHLGLNVTIAGAHGVLTPSLIAVQPATFEWEGRRVEPMGVETAKALELLKALDDTQREAAILGYQMRDVALGPGHDGETMEPEGVRVSTFTDAQKRLLIELVAEWSGIIHDAAAKAKLDEVKANLDQTWFAWAGPVEPGKAYYRVQGPTVIIEYAPQRLGGDVTQHIHSMFRDPTNDYGVKYTAR
jgi:hypothetical protein